jgi:hypothetical protein
MEENKMENYFTDLIRVEKKDLSKAAETISYAFMEDPLSIFFFPDESTRYQNLLIYFHVRINYGIRFGEVYATSNNFEGVVSWIPDKKSHITFWRGMITGGMKLYTKFGRSKVTRMFEVGDYTTHFRESVAKLPYIQLSPIGVHPEEQGKGFGSKLIEPMMNKLDMKNYNCYLETQEESNIGFYQRFNFKVVKEGKIPGTDLQHWVMMREPKK